MENVIGMVSAKWAEWDAYVEPLVFTYIEKVSFFRSRWWWQRCKRFLVCLYCQRKAQLLDLNDPPHNPPHNFKR